MEQIARVQLLRLFYSCYYSTFSVSVVPWKEAWPTSGTVIIFPKTYPVFSFSITISSSLYAFIHGAFFSVNHLTRFIIADPIIFLIFSFFSFKGRIDTCYLTWLVGSPSYSFKLSWIHCVKKNVLYVFISFFSNFWFVINVLKALIFLVVPSLIFISCNFLSLRFFQSPILVFCEFIIIIIISRKAPRVEGAK